MLSKISSQKLVNKMHPFHTIPQMVSYEKDSLICHAGDPSVHFKFLLSNDLKLNEDRPLLLDIYEIGIGTQHRNNGKIPFIFAEVRNVFLPVSLYYDADLKKVEEEFKVWNKFLKNCNVVLDGY